MGVGVAEGDGEGVGLAVGLGEGVGVSHGAEIFVRPFEVKAGTIPPVAVRIGSEVRFGFGSMKTE